jgi:hypothetical protein
MPGANEAHASLARCDLGFFRRALRADVLTIGNGKLFAQVYRSWLDSLRQQSPAQTHGVSQSFDSTSLGQSRGNTERIAANRHTERINPGRQPLFCRMGGM